VQRRNTQSNPFLIAFYLLVTGLGIGWLTGLSVSPVVSIVITSVTGAAAAIIAALSGLEDKPDEGNPTNKRQRLQWQVSPLPLTMVVIGIATGSIVGINARNHHWFGSSVSAEIAQWTDLGIAEPAIANRLFEQRYPYSSYTRPYTRTQTLNWLGGDLTAEVKRWTDAGLPQEEAARRLFEVEYPAASSRTANTAATQANTQFGSILFAAAMQEKCKTLTALAEKGRYDDLQTELSSSAPPLRELPTIVTDTVKLAQIVEKVLCVEPQP